jgi:hypothetical protein
MTQRHCRSSFAKKIADPRCLRDHASIISIMRFQAADAA